MLVRLAHGDDLVDLTTRSARQRARRATWTADGETLTAARLCLDTGTIYRSGELARGTWSTEESTRHEYQDAEVCAPDVLRSLVVTACHEVTSDVPLDPAHVYAIPYRYGRAGRLQTAYLTHTADGWRLLVGRPVATDWHSHDVLDLEIIDAD